MKHMAILLAAGLVASAAFAAPKALDGAALDKVSAGAGVLDWVLGGTPPAGALENGAAVDGVVLAEGNGTAVVGNGNDTGLLIEDNEYAAIAVGTHNKASYAEGYDSLIFGDNAEIAIGLSASIIDSEIEAEEEGAVAFMGDSNDLIYANIEDEGVVAGQVHADNSFNYQEMDIFADVYVDDSFNSTDNKMLVAADGPVTAIVFAAALDDQNVAANLNVTNASAATVTGQNDFALSVPFISSNAVAFTGLGQTVVNNSGALFVDVP